MWTFWLEKWEEVGILKYFGLVLLFCAGLFFVLFVRKRHDPLRASEKLTTGNLHKRVRKINLMKITNHNNWTRTNVSEVIYLHLILNWKTYLQSVASRQVIKTKSKYNEHVELTSQVVWRSELDTSQPPNTN